MSYICLQIREHNFIHAANPGVLQYLFMIEFHSTFVEFQSLKHDIHSNFVPKLKAVCQCFFRAVNLDGNAINLMALNACLKRPCRKFMKLHWWIVDHRRFAIPWYCDRNFVGNLCCNFMEGQCRYKADDRNGNSGGNNNKVGV